MAAPALFQPWQRRILLGLLFSGLALAIVSVLIAPRGVVYWLAIGLAPVVGALLGLVLGGERGAAIDAWLTGQGAAKAEAPRAPMPRPAALPAATRAALDGALVPVLLTELDAAQGAGAAAARALAAAPRDALARDLPRLAAGLLSGSTAAVAEAEDLARRLSPQGGRA